jgi:hypothetical protein
MFSAPIFYKHESNGKMSPNSRNGILFGFRIKLFWRMRTKIKLHNQKDYEEQKL